VEIQLFFTLQFIQNTLSKKKTRRESKEEPLKIFNVHGFVHRKNVLIYVQQDATLGSLFYLATAVYFSGGNSTHHQ
jgi:hypothetical protein